MIDALSAVHTLAELADLVGSDAWREHIEALPARDDALDAIEALRAAVADARARLSPEHAAPELQQLKAEVWDNPTAGAEVLRPLLARIAAIRATLPLRDHERLFGRLETEIGQRFAWASGGVGYSNRARRARNLFTEYAGQTHIAGAATDRHGNAAGTDYDLGLDGAFDGQTVHVLQLYSGEGFDFSLPAAAMARKGFTVDRRTAPGKVTAFRDWLADAQQLWLISNTTQQLKPGHRTAIAELVARGGALYVWGDNQPYYADANAILADLIGPRMKMTGNVIGSKVVKELADGRGFERHLVTTGLVHLFEGITVATVDAAAAEQHGFAPLLYGSAGNLITVVREPTAEGGAIMVDGAFTRLYCNWDEAGSARYVCNAACFLAATTPAALAASAAAARADDDEAGALPFVPDGAYAGVCDLTGKPSPTWLVLSVGALADDLANTTDLVLSDPLSAGARNCVFSDALYSETMGQWILHQPDGRRLDPITREPVVACLPLVDLSHPKNLRGFTDILCACLMGGKLLPTAARLLFFAVVDQMLGREDLKHRGAWEYLYRQALAHFPSTADFTEVGPKLPLLDAMTALFSPATDPGVQVRRSFPSVGVIGRTLVREGRATREAVRRIARRALLANLVRDALAADKAAPGAVATELNALLYEGFHGLPRFEGGRVAERRPSFVRDLWAVEQRLERTLGGTPLLTAGEYTVALHALLPYDLRQFSAEAAVARMCEDSPAFRAVHEEAEGHVGEPDAVALLNERFAAWAGAFDPADAHAAAPPFATTLGPSVFRCGCGASFGDPAAELTPENLAALRKARVDHFREVYRVRRPDPASWYPGDGTLHYNLHRAVQRVVAEQFPDALEVVPAMIPAVAAYLLRDGKGFVFDPLLPQCLDVALESYLALRRAGEPHPDAGVVTLEAKARREQAALQRR
jgi:hypothetical protein